ncbi:hypothetical protein NA56DRAFT_341927 [Hyaloscypha hepaticicola]|uniref:Uncharacterized protein n=1 Tax=Hyaloscypha hepaticicola TaxID=2082293 RepID=A0A2J6QJ64_9HELO|nr:hypothetical protein NA56DRAFT_341927 [Hyaloscypha hepaticicola]
MVFNRRLPWTMYALSRPYSSQGSALQSCTEGDWEVVVWNGFFHSFPSCFPPPLLVMDRKTWHLRIGWPPFSTYKPFTIILILFLYRISLYLRP